MTRRKYTPARYPDPLGMRSRISFTLMMLPIILVLTIILHFLGLLDLTPLFEGFKDVGKK